MRARLVTWWTALDPTERILYRGLGLASTGLAAVWWPLALILPGVVLTGLALSTAVASMRRPAP